MQLRACLKSVAAEVTRRVGTMKMAETIHLVTSAATRARVFEQALRRISINLLVVAICVVGAGCEKSTVKNTPTSIQAATSSADTIARVRWLGKKRIYEDANAIGLRSVWNLPESIRIEEQALDKFSLAPWSLQRRGADTNAGALLRPLLNDVLQEESCLEICRTTNQPAAFVFAIRLNDEQARVWQTNLAAVLESLTGIRPVSTNGDSNGWTLRRHEAPNLIRLTRAGDWTILGAAEDHNDLVGGLIARIKDSHEPFAPSHTNHWLQADLDLRRLDGTLSLGWNLPAGTPNISLTVNGDGQYVRTRGELIFPHPFATALEDWNVPTNLIHDPSTGFSAMRGIRPWVTASKIWKALQLDEAPDQLYFWSVQGAPMGTYFVAPMRDASNQVQKISRYLTQESNPWLKTDGMGRFDTAADSNGSVWKGVPFVAPQFQSVATNGSDYVLGGLMAAVKTAEKMPDQLREQVLQRTNLVFYDWEITGPRLLEWLRIGQLFRLVLNKPQIPPKSLSAAWFNAAAPNLGNSVTIVTQTATNQLSFARGSTVGFTAVELHLLADWFESPQFPRGFHTLSAPAAIPPEQFSK
jgi:hypothetical protein